MAVELVFEITTSDPEINEFLLRASVCSPVFRSKDGDQVGHDLSLCPTILRGKHQHLPIE